MDINTILTWPLIAINQRQLLYGGAAVATAYYIGGGWPNQGQSWMTLAQGYLGGGVVFSALYWNYVDGQERANDGPQRRAPTPGMTGAISSAALY